MSGYLNKYTNKKQGDAKSVVSQQSSKKVRLPFIQSTTTEGKTKEDILTKMQQNDEKHRQMMIENNKRRKEQERKLKQQEEEKQKQTANVLDQRKKTKEQAYVNYLRNNTKNILEGYQPRQTDYPKQNPKPIVEKKIQTNYNTNFEALDLEVSQVTKNKKLPQEFQKQWDDFEVMRKSELLDSLDLSTANQGKAKVQPKKTELHALLGLPEENSDDEEDLWKNTLKNGQLAKPPSKPPLSKPLQWAEQAITQADDVLSKMSQKQGNNKEQQAGAQKPTSETQINKQRQGQQSTSVPKKELVQKNQEQMKILQQKEQQLLGQQQKLQNQLQSQGIPINSIQKDDCSSNTLPIQQIQYRKPQPNIRITSKPIPKQPSSVQDEQNHIQEFLQEDLQNLNDMEMQLQNELMNLNKENKQKIEQVSQKYGVRNLQSSNQVNRIVFVQNQPPIKSQEDQIEASLLKLDMMLQQPPQKPSEQMQQQTMQQYDYLVQQPNQTSSQGQQYQPVQQYSQKPLAQQGYPQSQNEALQNKQLNPLQYQQLLDQQTQLQQQLQQAQYQIQQMQQQTIQQQQIQQQQQITYQQQQQPYQQQQQLTYQQQQQQTTSSQQGEFPQFPSYVLHQDHQSFVQTFTTGIGNNQQQESKQAQINARPRNVITHDSQSISIISSQQNDKYSFDLDFGAPKNTYTSQAQKKITQKQSQVKSNAPIEEEEEHEDGRIEVRQDLRNLLFD